jgi:hypothetical protein
MKRKLIIAGVFILFSWAFTSCESDCKVCKLVTYVNDVWESEEAGVEYCGLELIGIQNTPDVTVGTTRTTYECN